MILVAEKLEPVRCAKGMRVLPDVTTANCPPLGVLLVPGGQGTRREVKNEALLAWIAKTAAGCQWITSVCTGALLLTAAGPAKGKRVTTHWGFIEALRARAAKRRRCWRTSDMSATAMLSRRRACRRGSTWPCG